MGMSKNSKHRGTENTELYYRVFSVNSVPLCFNNSAGSYVFDALIRRFLCLIIADNRVPTQARATRLASKKSAHEKNRKPGGDVDGQGSWQGFPVLN